MPIVCGAPWSQAADIKPYDHYTNMQTVASSGRKWWMRCLCKTEREMKQTLHGEMTR